MPSLVTERIESVKAGILGAVAFAVAEFVIVIAKTWIIDLVAKPETTTFIYWELSIQLAIGAVSGFLFGVTYRYIVRDDRNLHLNDGAVLAFGLVRGLALIEGNFVSSELLSLLFFIFQSVVCFAIARSILDLAIARKLIEPFV